MITNNFSFTQTVKRLAVLLAIATGALPLYAATAAEAATNSEEIATGVTVQITCTRGNLPFNPAAVSVVVETFTNGGEAGQIASVGLLVNADFEDPQGITEELGEPTYTYKPLPRVFFGGEYPLNGASVRGSFETDRDKTFEIPNRGISTTCS